MDESAARSLAYANHGRARNRRGEPIIEHVCRVAGDVPPEARTVAWVHDLLEQSSTSLEQLREHGLGDVDSDALELLTRHEGESYELHVLRIAHAPGAAGRLARIVKLADLEDHLGYPWACGDPPYGWARRHVSNATAGTDVAAL